MLSLVTKPGSSVSRVIRPHFTSAAFHTVTTKYLKRSCSEVPFTKESGLLVKYIRSDEKCREGREEMETDESCRSQQCFHPSGLQAGAASSSSLPVRLLAAAWLSNHSVSTGQRSPPSPYSVAWESLQPAPAPALKGEASLEV